MTPVFDPDAPRGRDPEFWERVRLRREKEMENRPAGLDDPSCLTFLAEKIGEYPAEWATLVLLGLSRHPSPIVREGAVLGLAIHREIAGRTAILVGLAEDVDQARVIRQRAHEALESELTDDPPWAPTS